MAAKAIEGEESGFDCPPKSTKISKKGNLSATLSKNKAQPAEDLTVSESVQETPSSDSKVRSQLKSCKDQSSKLRVIAKKRTIAKELVTKKLISKSTQFVHKKRKISISTVSKKSSPSPKHPKISKEEPMSTTVTVHACLGVESSALTTIDLLKNSELLENIVTEFKQDGVLDSKMSADVLSVNTMSGSASTVLEQVTVEELIADINTRKIVERVESSVEIETFRDRVDSTDLTVDRTCAVDEKPISLVDVDSRAVTAGNDEREDWAGEEGKTTGMLSSVKNITSGKFVVHVNLSGLNLSCV